MVKELPPFESFAGQLLISAQNDAGDFFNKSVLLITEHSAEGGAVGYLLNRPMQNISVQEIFKDRDVSSLGVLNLKNGGPVDVMHGAVLHTDEYKTMDSHMLSHNLALTETQQILDDIAQQCGPHHFLIFIGKSAWAPGQLEEEIMGNIWITAPYSFDIVFNVPDNKKWQEALATLKIDANLLANRAGKA